MRACHKSPCFKSAHGRSQTTCEFIHLASKGCHFLWMLDLSWCSKALHLSTITRVDSSTRIQRLSLLGCWTLLSWCSKALHLSTITSVHRSMHHAFRPSVRTFCYSLSASAWPEPFIEYYWIATSLGDRTHPCELRDSITSQVSRG